MKKSNQMVEKGSQAYYERQVSMGRSTLLVVLCLTAANLLLLLSNTNFYLLFSASVPYYLTILARGYDLAAFGAVNQTYTWAAVAVSAVVLGLFLLFWLMSKKNSNWLVPGLVLFGFDSLCLLLMCRFIFGGFADSLLDLCMHGWVIYELAVSIRAARRLRDGAYKV